MIDVGATTARAAALLDRAAGAARGAIDAEIPRWFGRDRARHAVVDGFGTACRDARAAAEQLDELGTHGDAAAAIGLLTDRIDPAIIPDVVHARTYSAIADVPAHLSLHAEMLRLADDVRPLAPSAIRLQLREEIDSIVRRPDAQVTARQVRRIAAISLLPEDIRPYLPRPLRDTYPPAELVARKMVPGRDNIARGEIERMRLEVLRRDMVADPTVTRATLDAELRAIVATADDDVTTEQIRRMSLIAGMPDELRPALADTRMPWAEHRLQDLSAWGWHPASNGDARAKFTALRMAVEQEALIADPQVTRETVTAELQALLAIPDARLTRDQLYRTSLLARLPAHLRPPMPAKLDWHYRFEDLGLLRYHPGGHVTAARVFDQMRMHMAAVVDPEGAAAALKSQIDAGALIDFRVVAALAEHEGILHRHGLTAEMLHAQAVRALAGAGGGSRDALAHHVEQVRGTLEHMTSTDLAVLRLRDQALELADRNLARIAGTRTDTFNRHPDYAEIGRFVSIAQLLDALRPVATQASDAINW